MGALCNDIHLDSLFYDWKSCQANYGRFGQSVLHGPEFLSDCVQYLQSTRTALCQPQLPTRCSVAGFGD